MSLLFIFKDNNESIINFKLKRSSLSQFHKKTQNTLSEEVFTRLYFQNIPDPV